MTRHSKEIIPYFTAEWSTAGVACFFFVHGSCQFMCIQGQFCGLATTWNPYMDWRIQPRFLAWSETTYKSSFRWYLCCSTVEGQDFQSENYQHWKEPTSWASVKITGPHVSTQKAGNTPTLPHQEWQKDALHQQDVHPSARLEAVKTRAINHTELQRQGSFVSGYSGLAGTYTI